MTPIRPFSSPNISTRTLSRAYAVECSEKSQAVDDAVARYDKTPSYVTAACCVIPSAGLSIPAYLAHHYIRTQDKIEGNLALAKEIMNATPIPLSGDRQQLKAEGFLFTDVVLQDVKKVLVRRDTPHFSSAIDRLEHPEKLEEQEQEKESELVLNQRWERAFSRWASGGDDPAILIPGSLTVQDIQSRALNHIKTKAEEEARCYIRNNMDVGAPVESDLIQMAVIYALTNASLSPEQQTGPDNCMVVADNIKENRDALNTLRDIFGYEKPNDNLRYTYIRMLNNAFHFTQSCFPEDQAENEQVRGALKRAVTCCFNGLDAYSRSENKHDWVTINI
ncbi:MAG: hypothetical protein K0R08_1714 [Solimicrobium sp.]|jgi:hypothetical protein|nr:hypothetical protein [Solimicrobium sp.]